jgi:Radical SAM superfamily/Iron-sulfur cluster-binding domain
VVNVFGVKKEIGPLKNQSETFCMHPFTGLATREDGAILVCCRSQPIGWIQNESLEEIWNNENMKTIRKKILSGERPNECIACFTLEDQGVESLRQRHIKGVIPEARINLYPNALNKLSPDFKMPFEIPTMEIKLNNLCNLKCRMCHPMDSTSWDDWDKVEHFYKEENNFMVNAINELGLKRKPYLDKFDDTANWWDSFAKIIPHFRRAEFAGGEPLMDPQHYRILDMLAPYGDQIEIKYATNLTTLGIKGGRNVWDYWPKFKSVAVNVSIDGMGETYEHIRGNSSWDTVVENIKTLQSLNNISRIVGAVCVQAGNIMILDKMIEYFLDDLGIVFYGNRVEHPKLLSAQVIPQDLKIEAIRRLEAIKPRVQEFKLVKEKPILLGITLGQIQDNINYLNAKDQSYLWPKYIEFNAALDKSRNQKSIATLVPEFLDYV